MIHSANAFELKDLSLVSLQVNIATLYRALYGKMLSSVIACVGLKNASLAVNVVDSTFNDALELWPTSVPTDPQEWLFTQCHSRLIEIQGHVEPRVLPVEEVFHDGEFKYSQLRLLFIYCDPRLSEKARMILILRDLCGFRVDELVYAFDVHNGAIEDTLAQSIDVVIQNETLFLSPERLFSEHLEYVHDTLYAMFKEGCEPGAGEEIRREFCIEAMRMTRVMVEDPAVRNHDTFALFALMCLQASRFDSRLGTSGDLLELELQDRSRWDRELIQVGVEYLKHAHSSNAVTRYILEGAIASVHVVAERYEETNWSVIVGLYNRLADLNSLPMNDLYRCAAMVHTAGPMKALEFLQDSAHLAWLHSHYLYYVMMGKIYLVSGRTVQAVMAYEKALSLAKLKAEQDFLHRKILTIQTHLN
jgi:RNA polymerase sigma-70 factor (ECF subfamily)